MNKRQFSSSHYVVSGVVLDPTKYGERDSVPINQASSMDFNIDPSTGRPMSVITSIIRSQNAVEQQAAFAQLNEFKSQFLPSDMSNEDAFKFAFPSRCQLPSEIASVHEAFAKMALNEKEAKSLEAKNKKLAEENELFEKERQKYLDSLKNS